jgi:DNA modification methylase
MGTISIRVGDCRDVLRTLPEASVHCIVTSPPYFGLRDYGVDGQIGLEQTPDEYVAELVAVFAEARRVLRDDGTLWLNLGDSYAGSWGAQGKKQNGSISDGQVAAHPKTTSGTGSLRAWRQNTAEASGLQGGKANAKQQNRNGLGSVDGVKAKDLIGIPWRVAFALQADGWYLRQDIIWHKPNPMPESVTDRCTKAHEYVFLLAKSARYWYDAEAIAEGLAPSSIDRLSQDVDAQRGSDRVPGKTNGPMKAVGKMSAHMEGTPRNDGDRWRTADGGVAPRGSRNKRSVWSITTQPYSEAHFATMAPELARTCILAGCPEGGTVLDPFGGAGTTGLVADQLGRDAILIELNPQYAELARNRIRSDAGMFGAVA